LHPTWLANLSVWRRGLGVNLIARLYHHLTRARAKELEVSSLEAKDLSVPSHGNPWSVWHKGKVKEITVG
jgi:hypothetical protein